MHSTAQSYSPDNAQDGLPRDPGCVSSPKSSVAWSAIIAGALLMAAISLILLILGSGIGLSAVSPWSNVGVSATTFTIATAVWLIAIQCIASSFGGYLTGRLRSRWANMHGDEVYFRDTAHGLLAWAVATVITAGFLGAAVSSVIGGGVGAATAITAGAAAGAGYEQARNGTENRMRSSSDMMGDANAYLIDTLFRANGGTAATSGTAGDTTARDQTAMNNRDARLEATRILARGLVDGSISEPDKAYLAQVVASRTGVSNDVAAQRVDDVMAKMNDAKEKARQGMDDARKATMHTALWTFLSLLVGAFLASLFAACGGKHRDAF